MALLLAGCVVSDYDIGKVHPAAYPLAEGTYKASLVVGEEPFTKSAGSYRISRISGGYHARQIDPGVTDGSGFDLKFFESGVRGNDLYILDLAMVDSRTPWNLYGGRERPNLKTYVFASVEEVEASVFFLSGDISDSLSPHIRKLVSDPIFLDNDIEVLLPDRDTLFVLQEIIRTGAPLNIRGTLKKVGP